MAMTLNSNEQERVNNVYNEREKALAENNSMYDGLINNATTLRDQQNEYLAQQETIQNENLDRQFQLQQDVINQQKEEAAQNKRVEENKAINDYTSYINPYGLQNEQLFAKGLGNSGVSETSKLGAYTAYQNRVSAGNAAYQKAILQYDNEMNQAMADRDAQKAQNALNKLKLQLQNSQDYFSNVASLSESKVKNANSIRSNYNDQYNTVYSQILKEKQLAEDARQFNAQLAYNKTKNAGGSGGSGGSGGDGTFTNGSGSSYDDDPRYSIETYQFSSPTLTGNDKNWYNNEFEKHSYKVKDLLYVLDNAKASGKLSQTGYDRILSSYGATSPTIQEATIDLSKLTKK